MAEDLEEQRKVRPQQWLEGGAQPEWVIQKEVRLLLRDKLQRDL